MSHKEIGGSIVLHCGQPAPSQTENLLNFLLGQGGKHTLINHDQPTSFEHYSYTRFSTHEFPPRSHGESQR